MRMTWGMTSSAVVRANFQFRKRSPDWRCDGSIVLVATALRVEQKKYDKYRIAKCAIGSYSYCLDSNSKNLSFRYAQGLVVIAERELIHWWAPNWRIINNGVPRHRIPARWNCKGDSLREMPCCASKHSFWHVSHWFVGGKPNVFGCQLKFWELQGRAGML